MLSDAIAEPALPPPPKSPAGPAPARVSGSIRRTSSIDIDWPEGRTGPMRLIGRARDIATPRAGVDPVLLGEGSFEASLAPDRTVRAIATQPRRDVQPMIGQRAGGHLRGVIDTLLPAERRDGTPLHLILDDISGTSLIAPWAWSLWDPDWLANMARLKADPKIAAQFNRENICAGLRTGSSGLDFAAEGTAAGVVRDPADPDGWHAMPDHPAASMRRARRIDVAPDDGLIRIDAHFQDSATTPAGDRAALHEYRLRATADLATQTLTAISAEPRVLPFAECPAAAPNVARLVGTPLSSLRETVLAELRGTAGCTHLNDALRALADVPMLARRIAAAHA